MQQLTLTGVKRPTSQANRGRGFQAILNNTHLWYERQRWGKVYEIPNAFAHVSRSRWMNSPPELRARTEKGGLLLRVKSAPDYLGSLGGRHVEFDAKEFAGTSIDYRNFTEHQVDNLYSAERSGAIAGFIVLEKRTGAVHWVSAGYLRAWLDQIRTKRAGVAKSINFGTVAADGVRKLCAVERDSFAHYAPALVPKLESALYK